MRTAVWLLALPVVVGCTSQRSPTPSLPALQEAGRRGDTKALRALLENGSAVDLRDTHGRTALHWAAISGSADAATLLLNHGADADARAQFGMTPLHWAAMAGKANLVDLLLRRGANIQARNSYGMTPLHEAANVEVVGVLLARGAPVDERDYRGMTPLHVARNGKVAKTLLSARADPYAVSTDGRRPVETATGIGGEKEGLVIYSAHATARLRDERGALSIELMNVSERELGPLVVAAESPGCMAQVTPSTVARLDPGELAPLLVGFSRRPGLPDGDYVLQVTVLSERRPISRMSLQINTSRAEIPQDRGMMRIGKVRLVRASLRLQYLAFAAVPIFLAGLWFLWRRRRRPG